jgi:hypothetical protein
MSGTSTPHPHQVTKSAPFQLLVRVGLVTYGVVHLLVAWIVVQVATGDGGKADKTGALQELATAGGAWLLWLIAVGLGATVLWQLTEAVFSSGAPTRRRLVHFGEAVLFGYLAYSAGKIAGSSSGSSTDSAQQGLIGELLSREWGKPVVVAIGAAIVVAALFVVRHGIGRRFVDEHDYSNASATTRRTVIRLGQVGYAAIGVVYGIAGALVVVAALQADPKKATGLDVALKTLAAQSYGPVLLFVIAAGLTAFGVYCVVGGRFRRA